MRGIKRTIAFLTAAAAAAGGLVPASASPTPEPGVWLIRPDGSGRRLAGLHGNHHSGFAWAPDGSQLALSISGDVFRFDLATGESTNLTQTPTHAGGGYEIHPTWSPDGTRLAFSDGGDIWTIDSDGGNRTKLTASPESDGYPMWAPEGDLVSYQRVTDTSGRGHLNVVDARGGPSVGLAEMRTGPFASSWSPDARRIVYEGPFDEIRVVDVATTQSRFLAMDGYTPAWAPAGSRIAFGSREGLFVIEGMGEIPERIRDMYVGPTSGISWSPDGTRIALGSGVLGIADVESRSVVSLTATDETDEDLAPKWSPDGAEIAYVGITYCCPPHYWDRSVTATLKGHLVIEGRAWSTLEECAIGVRVLIQRRRDGKWRTLRRVGVREDGTYRVRLRDRRGLYRAITTEEGVTADGADYTCLGTSSEPRRHRHGKGPSS